MRPVVLAAPGLILLLTLALVLIVLLMGPGRGRGWRVGLALAMALVGMAFFASASRIAPGRLFAPQPPTQGWR